ncbi:DUF4238 domain-containing protein [Streptomyces sp. ST2-7A]|uniref:DUF4238 domain-containing protein n=1 Tax=Streptomyces sp. ST2-7A TaxID=2907214 RepID=UPI001F2914D3|nr:DUF4238 domain-containing protein [Streptomyces sp. ST2-7A]MCE7080700.1 DUF4238 domain-containing protein [Streptomyces sp. ST2-7A]
MAKRVRRQHTVSKFYLKGFASDAERICRVSLPGHPSIVQSIGDATVVKDFYSITLPDGSKSDHFEKLFGEVEGVAAEALRKVLSGELIEGEHREAFATWVALQHLRSEDIRSSQGSLSAGFIRIVVGASGKEALRSLIQESESRVVSDEELDWEWRDITKPGGPDLAPNVNQHMVMVGNLLPDTAAYLCDSHWTIYRFNRRSLVTSDHPVSLVVSSDYPKWQGVGILTAGVFLVPLSRRVALAIQPRRHLASKFGDASRAPDFEVSGTTQMEKVINQETVKNSRRYIYHHPDDSPLGGLWVPQREDRARMSFSDGGELIREEGLFSGMTEEQLRAWSGVTSREDGERGMSINDLPWPIPGRRGRRWDEKSEIISN